VTSRIVRSAAALALAAAALVVQASPARADPVRDRQWHLAYLEVADAQRISKGEGVTVAVIDSGVDPHRDLRGNLLPGTDFVGNSDGRMDPTGHGTGMAGLIAARGHDAGDGALGIAPAAKILPIRFTDDERIEDPQNGVDRSVRWAVQHGAKVVSISLGGGPDPDDRAAVEEALAADVVVVAGVGNRPSSRLVQFPAAYPGVVAVAAVGRDGAIAPVSVRGNQVVIAAPGVDIVSTSRNDEYRKATGTSDATAIVAGAVALVRSRFPNLSAAEVVHRLTATATDKGPKGRDDQYGYGVLNLVAALTADVARLEADGTSAPRSPTPSTTTAVAAPGGNGGRDVAALVGAVAVAALLGGGLVMLAVRRRRPGR
jgi:type VII secretion-associated serine protease mycosin